MKILSSTATFSAQLQFWLLWCSGQLKLHIFKTVNTQWRSSSKSHILFAKGSNCSKTFQRFNNSKFCLRTTQLANNCMSSSINHYTVDNKIKRTAFSANQCTTACHCSLLLYIAFMPVPFVVKFAFLQRIGCRIRDALMQILLIPLILFSNCGWKLNTVNITQNTWKPK